MLTIMQQKLNKKLTRGIIKKVAFELGLSIPAAYMRVKRKNVEALKLATKFEKEHQKNVIRTLKKYYKVTNGF
jgi:hypothetical protein